jgi:chitin disaccharide deacetylase
MSRQLIVNADDFGRSRGVSDGILLAHRDGIVTGTTAMMNMPGVTHDLQRAATEAPRLGLGVHLTFTAGRPLLPMEWVRSLVDERDHFLSQEAILQQPTRIDPDELMSELKAQVNTFKNALGHLPDHLDAHHFVHLCPPLFRVYLDLADSFDLPIRLPIPRQPAALEQIPALLGDLSAEALEPILQADWAVLAGRSIRTTDHFVMSFFGHDTSVAGLLDLLEGLPDGVTELMTHPGLADEHLRAESSYNVERERELATLTDPQVLAQAQKLGIELITYAQLN